MLYLDSLISELNNRTLEAIRNASGEQEGLNDEYQAFMKNVGHVKTQLKKFHKTGKYIPLNVEDLDDTGSSSLKENDVPPNGDQKPKVSGRGKRPGPLRNTNNSLQSEDLFNIKNLKREKTSDESLILVKSEIKTQEVKTEQEEMPAPKQLPPRKKKIKSEQPEPILRSSTRTTRTKTRKIKEEAIEEANRKDSDIILQCPDITTIDLVEDDKSDIVLESDTESVKSSKTSKISEPKAEAKRTTRTKTRKGKKNIETGEASDTDANVNAETSTRSTRTKTRAKQKEKRARDSTEERDAQEKKKSRSNSASNDTKMSVQTEYEDAVSSIESSDKNGVNSTYVTNATFVANSKDKNANATYVASPLVGTDTNANATYVAEGQSSSNPNATMVVENPKYVNNIPDDLMTDDDSDIEIKKTAKKVTSNKVEQKSNKSKTVFNPFEQSPMKKKVEAFEKLASDKGTAIPLRVLKGTRSAVKAKKVFTPVINRAIPACSSYKGTRILPGASSNESLNSGKSASALKACQAEYREREKRREADALKKREALLKAQTEEKRKKREEKQTKAQQQRGEVLEKEKHKLLEQQRMKEERTKQLIAEKEEKQQKIREEMERKRLYAKEKAAAVKVLKKKEEILRLEEQRRAHLKQTKHHEPPEYMITQAPLLPTEDCYDSDDERGADQKPRVPSWCRSDSLITMQKVMIAAGERLKNTFYCRLAVTPDLLEIFESIDPHKLKRTSSAIWRIPPRYTLMPTIEQLDLEEEYDSD